LDENQSSIYLLVPKRREKFDRFKELFEEQQQKRLLKGTFSP